MAITAAQRAQAEQHQWSAAQAPDHQVRLVAGPGTGKTNTIEKRVSWLLGRGVQPQNLFVISFTRATCAELQQRIVRFCAGQPHAIASTRVRVSTMHSLALRILRQANLLNAYPTTPVLLDDWEQECVYDQELSRVVGCTPKRAAEIRRAHDAQWQTLNPAQIAQAQITPAEITAYNAFHASRTNLYSCVLPGEVIHKCVQAFQQGNMAAHNLPPIDHLIVDEYQDLNACDQSFVNFLSQGNTVLFVAGDDDQSIYSFRHADPNGIINFVSPYPQASTHGLAECFRCTPAVLAAADRLIGYNPNRLQKNLTPMYAHAAPPVQGQVHVWRYATPEEEARGIADSCVALQQAGMAGREDQILVLISNRRLQLRLLSQEFRARNLPFDSPNTLAFSDESEGLRAVYSAIRILRNTLTQEEDYPAYRDLLGLLAGVGDQTAKEVGDLCVANNGNFRAMFHAAAPQAWMSARAASAVGRVIAVVQSLAGWTMADTVGARVADITTILATYVFTRGSNAGTHVQAWTALAAALPTQMTLEELLQFLAADSESDQEKVFRTVQTRIAQQQNQAVPPMPRKIRLLTMHGSKGLTGSVVFIPSAEQGIMPNLKALQAPGLLIEQRRLFYVALTRTRACCIVSHSMTRTGFQAQAVVNRPTATLQRSQFLNEMAVPTVNRRYNRKLWIG